jgi:hypothetical protein
MSKKLINEVLKDYSIRGALKYTGEHNSILVICGQYLVPLVAMEVGYLQWCRAERRPACPSEPNSFITSRLIHIDQVIRLKVRQVMHIGIS